MKHLRFLLIALAACSFFACEPKPEPEQPEQPEQIPASFPRKHLIEEFTGQGCGYCPYGMDCIHAFLENDTNYIVILHHYGYQADHFSVPGSKTITSALKVNGAPSMAIDRAKTKYGTQSAVVFHPGYLEDVNRSQFVDTTYASVLIDNTYDPASRTLHVRVSGVLCRTDDPNLQLTVLVKESGMIDTQADYENTFEGWQEFRHTNAVRAFLTAPKGDILAVQKQHYSEEYDLTLPAAWVPENCMVVAFLSEEFQPVVQAAQKPVVSGSKGGADILHGGLTPVAVPDYYPEYNATQGPGDLSENRSEHLNVATASYTQYASLNITFWQIQAYNASALTSVAGTSCVPFAQIYVMAPYSESPTLPTGTFPVSTSEEPGTVWAGQRDDANFQIFGSMFYFTSKSYFDQGYLDPRAQWLISDGELTISDGSWTLSGHARNGASINLNGDAITNRGSAQAPRRLCGREAKE